jgi:hypothetical protein
MCLGGLALQPALPHTTYTLDEKLTGTQSASGHTCNADDGIFQVFLSDIEVFVACYHAVSSYLPY